MGSAGGGLAFDTLGFEFGTTIVLGMQSALLLTLPLFTMAIRKEKANDANEADERTPLLRGSAASAVQA